MYVVILEEEKLCPWWKNSDVNVINKLVEQKDGVY